VSGTRTARKRTRGILHPEAETAIELVLALKREAPIALPSDGRLIGMCTACGYLGYVEEIASAPREHRRIQRCEACRGLNQGAERQPVRSELAVVSGKRGVA
jgi:hypothetical protein